MAEIPPNVVQALAAPAFRRTDVSAVGWALQRLRVSTSDEFKTFYERFEGPFAGRTSGFQLLDLVSDEPSIVAATELCRREFGIADDILVLTDLLGGGALMYRCATDEVFNVDFEGGDQLLAQGALVPEWSSFTDFLKDFFG